MPQISASVKENTIKVIEDIAKEKDLSFSRTVDVLLTSAAAQWIKNKSAKKSKTK